MVHNIPDFFFLSLFKSSEKRSKRKNGSSEIFFSLLQYNVCIQFIKWGINPAALYTLHNLPLIHLEMSAEKNLLTQRPTAG